ncbi:MAG: hypothetical protein WD512_05210 [Candidatus Paceibacterota bacterium]
MSISTPTTVIDPITNDSTNPDDYQPTSVDGSEDGSEDGGEDGGNSMKNPSVFTSGEKKIANYEEMCEYVIHGDRIDPAEQYKSKFMDMVHSLGKNSTDSIEQIYQVCLNKEFGEGVGDRFIEMFHKHARKIQVPAPYCYFGPKELEFITKTIFFCDCLDQMIRIKLTIDLEEKKKKEDTQSIQNLLDRIKFLEKQTGLSHHLQAN